MKRVKQDGLIFTLGGIAYGTIEIIWRRYTHWTMLIAGGTCFLILFKIFSKNEKLSLLKKCIIGSTVITVVELIAGCVVNIWLKLKVWDYSHLPINFLGQICLIYSTLWGLLTVPISFLCRRIKRTFKII
ncbi:MAG: hypothetical protein Q8876_00405 [Bacillota bacterium]|nr:hypothetical protein [Bacillota bacterium]